MYAIAGTGLPWPVGALLAFVPVLDALVGLGGRNDLTVAAVPAGVALWCLRRRDARRCDDAAMFRFVRRPPATVGDLAGAVGVALADLAADGRYGMGSVMTPTVSASYAWDLYHEPPVASVDDLAGRRLVGYSVRFTTGRSACERELAAAYGAPVAVAGRARYGPFFVTGGEPFTLEWYATTPDWAEPPADADARISAVERLSARLTTAVSAAEVTAALAGVPGGSASATGLRFRPPMPAADLVRAFGWVGAVAQTVDVHMSSWAVALVAGGRTERPRVGRWRVDAYLAGRPSGGTVPGVHAPAASVAHLGADDAVGSVTITPA